MHWAISVVALSVCFLALSTDEVVADTYALTKVEEHVSQRDLEHLASALGVRMVIFDYEVPRNHCVHFSVELHSSDLLEDSIDGPGQCGRGGPHRLTVQWREKDGEVQLYYYLNHLVTGSGGGTSGPRFNVSGYGGRGGGGPAESAGLEFGNRVRLTSASYTGFVFNQNTGQAERDWRKHIVVFVELRENPDGVIGSE